MALTLLRLLLVVPLVFGIASNRVVAGLTLAVIVFVDVMDGAVARRIQADGRDRRLTDAIVDKVMIHSASLAMVIHAPRLLALYAPLFIRDAIICVCAAWFIIHRNTFIAGQSRHRLASVAYALLGAAALFGEHDLIVYAAILAWVVHYALLGDYLSTARNILSSEPNNAPIAMRIAKTNASSRL